MGDGLTKIKEDPASSAVYDELLRCLDGFAEYDVEVKGASVHITHGRAFLGVHPRKAGLLVNVVTTSAIESDRLKKTERVSANRYHNEIVLHSTDELDDEVASWLRTAYSLTRRASS